MTELQFNEICKWQKETFPKSTAHSKSCHLRQEVEELIDDLETGNWKRRLEFADCFILLYGAAAADGMTLQDITDAMHEKMEINYKRKWGNPDENGVVNHIK